MFHTPNSVLVARAGGVGGAGFGACHLLALSMRDHGFHPTLGSAAFEHLGAILFVLFALGFVAVLRKWEAAEAATNETPASDAAGAALGLLAIMLIVATATRIAGALGHETWNDIAFALDVVCLLPMVVLIPFVTIASLSPEAPTGFAIAGAVAALGGLMRAAALLVDSESSIFHRSAVTGSIAFALFVIWVALGAFFSFRVKQR